MEFFLIIIALMGLSFFGALLSLKKELSKPKEVKRAEEAFKKEKILFKKS